MRRSASLAALVASLLVTALLVSGVAAKGGPPGGVGEEPTEEATNNLSVPAIFVPGVGVGTPSCTNADDAVLPLAGAEDPADGLFPGYWLQGEDTWQADCVTALDNTVTVTAEWGDNLQFAPLKQGTPIRVEMGMLADAALYQMMGFGVDNLTPTLDDRNATYGTRDGTGIAAYAEVRVWNAGATVSIVRSDGLEAYSGAFTAEINSTGRVVYGYNWQKPVAGTYTITFFVPTVAIGATDAGTIVDAHTVTLDVVVADKAGGGGGGGGGGGHGGGGGGGGGGH